MRMPRVLSNGDLGLPERQRKRLGNPQSVVRRWQRETQTQVNGKCPTDLKCAAKAAWRRFVWCLRSLPMHEACPLWEAVTAELMSHASRQGRSALLDRSHPRFTIYLLCPRLSHTSVQDCAKILIGVLLGYCDA
jgi:hypothetical protein